MMKFIIIGLGYVGLSLSVFLGKNHTVIGVDTNDSKLKAISEGVSPINDTDISRVLRSKTLDFQVTNNLNSVIDDTVDAFIITVPTDGLLGEGILDTSIVDSVVKQILAFKPNAFIIIRSTVPIGHTQRLNNMYHTKEIIFSPEFIREGVSYNDNLYPSRIIVGDRDSQNKWFGNLLLEETTIKDSPVMHMGTSEAEAVKLFSNSYLAMRVAFFNELDTFANSKKLDTENIIKGVSLDSRIGNYYNNPSFGFGGYCLPKDSMELISEFDGIPNALISSINLSNEARINYIVSEITTKNPTVVGVYKLAMKMFSDNYRTSSIMKVITNLIRRGLTIVVFDDNYQESSIVGVQKINNFDMFIEISDIIISNRKYEELSTVSNLYTRDIFNRD